MKATRKKSAFPDTKVVAGIRERLSDSNYQGGNVALPNSASEGDRAKYQICQLIARYQREHAVLQKDIARQIGVDASRISDILRGRIEDFTLDCLISYAERLHPRLRVQVIAA